MENLPLYLKLSSMGILCLQLIYNLLMQGGAAIRMENLQSRFYSNKDYRESVGKIAQRDYDSLRSVRFNHLLNFALALLAFILLLISISLTQ